MDLSVTQVNEIQKQLEQCQQSNELIALTLELFLSTSQVTEIRLIDLHPEPYQLAEQIVGQTCVFNSADANALPRQQLIAATTRDQEGWHYQATPANNYHILAWPKKISPDLCLVFASKHFTRTWLKQRPLLEGLLRQIGYQYQQQKTQRSLEQKVQAKQEFANQAKAQKEQEAQFIESLMLLQNINLKLSNAPSLDQLHKQAVESLRSPLGFDRSALFLMNPLTSTFNPTYGTDEQGNTTDEHTHVYDMHKMSPIFMQTCLQTREYFVVLEDVPLFTNSCIVGYGWNAMLILRDGETLLGWIALDNLINSKPITRHDKEILRSFSHMFSQILVRKRAEESLKMLYNSAEQLSHADTLLDVCRAAVILAKKELMLDRVAIFLTDDNGQTMRGTYGSDLEGNLVDETGYQNILPNNRLIQHAIAHDDIFVIEEPATLYHNGEVVGTGWNALLQLRSDNKVIGFIIADNLIHGHALNLHTQQLIRIFGTNLSEMIARKQAEENLIKLNKDLEKKVQQRTQELEFANQNLAQTNLKLEQLTQTDALTGVANRRSLDQRLQFAWNHACRNQIPLIVTMLDVDNFKTYNDNYGHLKGDDALKAVAQVLAEHFRRADDTIARYGGEEFAIIMLGVELEEAATRVNQVISALANKAITHHACAHGIVTISAGMAQLDYAQPQSQANLVNQADVALYQAKKNGKNQLIIYSLNAAASALKNE
nr:GGDEF domain-containing protein [Motilimonas cestriensis]